MSSPPKWAMKQSLTLYSKPSGEFAFHKEVREYSLSKREPSGEFGYPKRGQESATP